MGKQTRFYTLPNDEISFWEFISSIPDIHRLSDKSSSPEITSFVIPWERQLIATRLTKYLITTGEIKNLQKLIRQSTHKIWLSEIADYIDTGEKFYWIDSNSPHVEYSTSFIRYDDNLVQGRIWVDLYSVGENQFVYKGDDLKMLYETLASWIRKNFKKLKGVDGYFGPEALVWYQDGGQLFP